MADTKSASSLFVPAAILPPRTPPSLWRVFKSALSNPIEMWPQEVWENPVWKSAYPLPAGQVLICDPDAIAQVLQNEQDFPRAEIALRALRALWGNGMVASRDAQWRWQRQAAAPAFRHEHISQFMPQMSLAAERTLDTWRAAGRGARIDIAGAMMETVLQVMLDTLVLARAAFPTVELASGQINALSERVGRNNLGDLLPLPTWLRPSAHQRGGPPADYLRERISNLIAQRRKSNAKVPDLVGQLMAATDPSNAGRMSDELLRDNVIGFLVAGHATSAMTLTWAIHIIANHPPTGARLISEINAVVGDAPIHIDHLEKLTFTRQVIQETLRLYPNAAMIIRQAARDAMLAGVEVRRGALVIIPVYALHRHRTYWENPDAFDPERFSRDRKPPLRNTYLPFGTGPRFCIGAAFAMTQVTAILVTLLRGATFIPDTTHIVQPIAGITLRPKGGMPMFVLPR